jgi:hypothetical protein
MPQDKLRDEVMPEAASSSALAGFASGENLLLEKPTRNHIYEYVYLVPGIYPKVSSISADSIGSER